MSLHLKKVGSTSAFCCSQDTTAKDPAKAMWDDVKVSAVDVEETWHSMYNKDRFHERFIDPDFKPGPEVDIYCFSKSALAFTISL